MKFKAIAILLSAFVASSLHAQYAYGGSPYRQNDWEYPHHSKGLFLMVEEGGQIIYDANNQVFWLSDANFAASPEGRRIQTEMGVEGIQANGAMDYPTALKWVQALNTVDWHGCTGYLCHTDWQLPVTPLTDKSCAVLSGPYGGSFGPLCTGSALGRLYSDGLELNYPGSVAPDFNNQIGPIHNLRPSYYWAAGTNIGGENVFDFSTFDNGGVTTKYNYYYTLPMVPGAIGTPPACTPGSTTLLPYTSGTAAGKAVFECGKGYSWSTEADLASKHLFGDEGDTTLSTSDGQVTVPLVNANGAMLFGNGAQPSWIDDMKTYKYAGSGDWMLPSLDDLQRLFNVLQLQPGDTRFLSETGVGPFQNMQPYYYWMCERDQPGDSRSPCNGVDAPTPPNQTTPMEWSFNFDTGFQGTAENSKYFHVMIYHPAPMSSPCPNPVDYCPENQGSWNNSSQR